VNTGSLALSAGSYWMTLALDAANNESFVVGTGGANGINAVIDGTSLVTGPYWAGMQNVGAYLQPFTGHSNYDFSYGVVGNAAVPEPSTWTFLLPGIALIGLGKLRRS